MICCLFASRRPSIFLLSRPTVPLAVAVRVSPSVSLLHGPGFGAFFSDESPALGGASALCEER